MVFQMLSSDMVSCAHFALLMVIASFAFAEGVKQGSLEDSTQRQLLEAVDQAALQQLASVGIDNVKEVIFFNDGRECNPNVTAADQAELDRVCNIMDLSTRLCVHVNQIGAVLFEDCKGLNCSVTFSPEQTACSVGALGLLNGHNITDPDQERICGLPAEVFNFLSEPKTLFEVPPDASEDTELSCAIALPAGSKMYRHSLCLDGMLRFKIEITFSQEIAPSGVTYSCVRTDYCSEDASRFSNICYTTDDSGDSDIDATSVQSSSSTESESFDSAALTSRATGWFARMVVLCFVPAVIFVV